MMQSVALKEKLLIKIIHVYLLKLETIYNSI